MVTRKDLQNFRNNRLEISLLRRHIAELEDLTLAPDINQWGKAESALKDKIGAVLTKKDELKALYINRLHELLEMQSRIEEFIKGIENPQYANLVRLVYVEGKSWAQTADIMGFNRTSTISEILKRLGL